MYKVFPARSFERDAKVLLKKYVSLREELSKLAKELALNPTQGTPLGNNCYKIRQAIKSKGKGKSGGARIITYVITDNEEVILLAIYDKAEKENLSPGELDELLGEI
ncbi:MAG: type II toxin-antitoxin system RelE/ParE family toxin [Leadbetterella sp.]|nr:type II toxin-antitoxin system RelE/ParE family toxin [Leadbetterella sp.]